MTKLYLNTDGDFLLLNSSDDWLQLDAVTTAAADYPSTPAWMEASISSYSPTFVSVTHGLNRQARSRGGHAWLIDLRYGGMTRAAFAPLWAFLNKQGGQYGTFTISLPSFAIRGAGGGTPLVKGASQTGTTLLTDGWPNTTAVLKSGDFFQIENDPKVYQVTDDVTSDGSSNASLPIFPALQRVPADNAVINTSPLFKVALSSDTLATDWSQCVYAMGFHIELVEVR